MITTLPSFLENPDPCIFLSDNYLVLDMENAHYGTGFPDAANKKADIILTCYYQDGIMRHKWGNEYSLGKLIDKINSVDFIVAHNAQHELGWLARAGLDLTTILAYDTMIGEYVIAGNRKFSLGLGDVAETYGYPGKDPLVDKMIKGSVCPSEIPAEWLLSRCVYDVNTTHNVFLKQRQKLKEDGLLKVFFSRCLFTPVLADMSPIGMNLDADKVLDLYEDALVRKAGIERQLDEYCPDIKWSSPAKVAEYMYDVLKFQELKDKRGQPIRTSTGRRSAAKATILQLKCTNKKQREFVETYTLLSVVSAELSKSLEFFYGVITEGDGIFTARFNQVVTVTHRLSSTGKSTKFDMYKKPKSVQFQNFKREFKVAFKARHKGWSIAEADAAGAEFRMAAALATDETACDAIRDHFDVHTYTASKLNDIPVEEVTKEQRQDAKPDTFKPLYGGTSGTEAQVRYYEAFAKMYPDIRAMQDAWVDEAMTKKQITLITGLKAYFPFCKMTSTGYVNDNTKVRNLPIQCLATAEMIPVVMIYKWHRMKANNMKSFIVNSIHDSSIVELHPDEHELYKEITVQAYLQDVYTYMDKIYGFKFPVPLGVEYKAGHNWGGNDILGETLVELEPTYT